MKQKGHIEFESTSFLRGLTLDNCLVIIDESQNANIQELRTVCTRIGENSRLIVCGDVYQDDLTSERYNEVSGLSKLMTILSRMPSVSHIEFDEEDIVRSGFCKEFIIAESNLK